MKKSGDKSMSPDYFVRKDSRRIRAYKVKKFPLYSIILNHFLWDIYTPFQSSIFKVFTLVFFKREKTQDNLEDFLCLILKAKSRFILRVSSNFFKLCGFSSVSSYLIL